MVQYKTDPREQLELELRALLLSQHFRHLEIPFAIECIIDNTPEAWERYRSFLYDVNESDYTTSQLLEKWSEFFSERGVLHQESASTFISKALEQEQSFRRKKINGYYQVASKLEITDTSFLEDYIRTGDIQYLKLFDKMLDANIGHPS